MKIVLNKCYGGFGLSPLAMKALAKLNGKKCYFFKQDYKKGLDADYEEITLEEATKSGLFYSCFSVKNPNELLRYKKDWNKLSDKEKEKYNKLYDSISLDDCRNDEKRNANNLIKVVEKLGKKANGRFAELEIVDIPDDVKWEISDYDGVETIHEIHRSW